MNTCIALRGQSADYEEWAALGLREWSWEACLPAFKALETDLDFGEPWHGKTGPIPIRRHCVVGSGYHPCGTVPMGLDADPLAATDARGRVRRVRDLWVADASLVPTIPSANTNLPSLMIGERIAAFLHEAR